jgi:hypothetical protein
VSELRNEVLLRLSKLVVAGVAAAIIYLVATGPAGVGGSFELALLCWISAAVGLSLLESSPI